ncbi:unnamed protein product [Rhizophagus irregularis]|uniref:RNase H type-1 domain-containing protein n=1 Tax=Rhizophagus irregularis TaxID=588596 RepID=A0A915ZH71_9GLOM|nr:unnamed protein product [Rhizophagus irregularis]
MDDTNFMAGNQENLEKILSIADTFYNLNDIKINKDKSELLLRKKYIPESLSLSFGKSIVNIKPTSKKGSIRLLGVWFNAFNRRNHVIDQIKNEINNCCDSMILRKKLTDKQMAFIFNVLIIPRIEYRAQLIILSEYECNKIMAKFRILFKHKLKFMKTTPNSIVHLKEMFNVKNIEDNQLQAKTTNFILQINDKNELGMITKIRLYNLQQLLFLNDNPIYSLQEKDIIRYKKIFTTQLKNHYILECIKMLKTQNFSIAINDTIDKMEIIGGNILIKDILPEEIYFKNLRSIKKLNIMFADQILTPNRSLIEKSWKIIEDCILDNNEIIKRRISIEATNKIGTSFAHNLKGTILTKMNSDSEPINNGFIFGKKKLHNDIILVYGKNYNLGSNDIVLEHYITVNNPDDLFMGLKKCLGCFLDETSTLGPLERIHKQSNCLVKLRIEDVYFLENYLHSHAMIIHETDSYIVPDIIQSHIESNIWHEHNFIIKPMLFKEDDIRLNIFESNMQKSTHNCIEKYVKKEKFNKNLTIEKLNVINYKLIQQLGEQIFIYIDGSVINNGTENIDGIAGLHFYDKDHKLIDEFYVNIEHWISPSKAEVTSFIIALIIVHNISNVEIITDNEFIFNYFNDIICKTEIYNTRKLLKTQNNIYIWALIRQFIDLNEIIIPKITKIKAHDDDLYHNFLDQQIKDRYSDRNRVYSVNFNFFQLDKIEYMLTWNNIIIEKPIRRFIRYYNEILNLEKFFNLRRNRKYTIDSVEWAITFEFLKENENVLQTNFHTTKRRRYKIKNLIEEIPTVEQRKLTNFDIYKDWKCPVCERKKETFGHVWRCYSNRKRMRNIIYYSIICLIEKIKEYDIYTFDEAKIIDLFINESFGEVKVNNNKLTFVDIIKGLFPKLLADFLRQEIKMTKVHIFETGVKFLDFVFDSTHKIWVDRCDLQKDKEISLGVTKEDKKHYSYDKNIVKKDINHKVYQKVEGLLNNIYFNIEPLDFIVRVNHYPGSSGI